MKNILSFVCRDCENTILTEKKIYIIKLPRWLVTNVYMEKNIEILEDNKYYHVTINW